MNLRTPANHIEQNLDAFLTRCGARELVIAIVGLGYVGLPLANAALRKGFRVIGVDVDASKVEALLEGRSYIRHIDNASIRAMTRSGRFEPSSDFSVLRDADAVIMCVPTPLTLYREPDMSYIENTSRSIARHLRRGQLVVLESTTYPGTTNEVVLPLLEESGLKSDTDFGLAYSPEREDPGNPNFETSSIPKVVGADTEPVRQMAQALYGAFVDHIVPVADTKTAEAVKITENIFRAVNIALVNELKVLFSAMDIDVWNVIDAAKTKPFGFMPFYPGPGLGGHCIPIDPFYLTWKAREFGLSTRFIELAGEINNFMPRHVIETCARELSDRCGLAMKGAKVLVVGLAYKKNVDDMRESPSLVLVELLRSRGAEVSYYDPFVPVVPVTREHPELAGETSIAWSPETLRKFDMALISTDHDGVDYEELVQCVPLTVDTRNVLKDLASKHAATIAKA